MLARLNPRLDPREIKPNPLLPWDSEEGSWGLAWLSSTANTRARAVYRVYWRNFYDLLVRAFVRWQRTKEYQNIHMCWGVEGWQTMLFPDDYNTPRSRPQGCFLSIAKSNTNKTSSMISFPSWTHPLGSALAALGHMLCKQGSRRQSWPQVLATACGGAINVAFLLFAS